MSAKKSPEVPRPLRKSEFRILFASKQAERGWRDLVATQRNAAVNSWETLAQRPLELSTTQYPLKGTLSEVQYLGKPFTRWQLKPSAKGTARIWYFVFEQCVYLEQVHTHHPNETKR